jgi:hypothetical protein
MREGGKMNLLKDKTGFDGEFWNLTSNDDKKKKKIPYFYENLKDEPSNLLEIRSKIIWLAQAKWKIKKSLKKEVLSQTVHETHKLSTTKSNIDISKAIFNTDFSGPKSKNASCIIF